MSTLIESLAEAESVLASSAGARRSVDAQEWRALAQHLQAGHSTLVSLWGDDGCVHMAILDSARQAIVIASIDCEQGGFPSVGLHHRPAIRLERAARDLYGHQAVGALDVRPWLDHGRWPIRAPLGAATPGDAQPAAYAFLKAEGDGLHQIPVGPVHAGIIEPGHFRFSASGEAVVRLEERLGYVHKGMDRLMAGASLDQAALLAGRQSGDSTVAYAIAFARAVEKATALEIPARADWLRALMAELERLANHFGDIGAICNDASFALMQAHCAVLRERVLRVAQACFGHRLMMDVVVPGGVSVDLTLAGRQHIQDLQATIRAAFPRLVTLYDNTASLQDRTVRTGVLRPDLARQFGCGGYVGRASGRDFDARRDFAFAPYDQLRFAVPALREGDVNARVWIRIREVEQSLSLIDQILAALPTGSTRVETPAVGEAREGFELVEGFRGDVFAWVRLGADGRVTRCHLRDPSWFHWPVLEAAIEGNIVADFPICNKSFNCSYSGHDL